MTIAVDFHRPQQRSVGIYRDNWGAVEVIACADQLTKLQRTVSYVTHQIHEILLLRQT